MLADLSIIPMGGTPHTSGVLAEVLKVIEASGLRYQLTPTTTCIEGSWDQISDVSRRCHELVRTQFPHVVTLLRFEDDEGVTGKLAKNPAAVEAKAGQAFPQSPVEAVITPPPSVRKDGSVATG